MQNNIKICCKCKLAGSSDLFIKNRNLCKKCSSNRLKEYIIKVKSDPILYNKYKEKQKSRNRNKYNKLSDVDKSKYIKKSNLKRNEHMKDKNSTLYKSQLSANLKYYHNLSSDQRNLRNKKIRDQRRKKKAYKLLLKELINKLSNEDDLTCANRKIFYLLNRITDYDTFILKGYSKNNIMKIQRVINFDSNNKIKIQLFDNNDRYIFNICRVEDYNRFYKIMNKSV